jgi:hypothetical protein
MSDETTIIVRPTETTLKTVSVKVSRQVDLGFVPYIKYVKSLNGKPIPFGSRDQSRTEFDVFLSAEVGSEDTAEHVIAELSRLGHEMTDRILREQYPEAFKEAVRMEVPEEAFTIRSTQVERVVVGDF